MRSYGYRSAEQFVKDVIRRYLLKLRKKEFLEKAGKIRTKLKREGCSEKEILEDFEKFRRDSSEVNPSSS